MLQSASQWLNGLPSPLTFGLGVVLLLAGGHWLVDASVRIARAFGVSTLFIGLTVVAFGTSSPELAFNILAAKSGHGDLSFGNVVGSNIANLSLVLGGAAVICPIVVHSRVIRRELPLLMVISFLMVMLAALPLTGCVPAPAGGGGFLWPAGIMLLAGFVIVSWAWYRLGSADRADPLGEETAAETGNRPPRSLGFAVVLFLVGLAALVGGGELTKRGAIGIASSLGLPPTVIGLTIVALATSLPEVVTSLVAAARGHGDLAMGNVVGSNLFNILLVLGTTSLIGPVEVPMPFGWWDMGVMLGVTLVLVPIAMSHQGKIMRWEGLLLLGCYCGYIAWTVVR